MYKKKNEKKQPCIEIEVPLKRKKNTDTLKKQNKTKLTKKKTKLTKKKTKKTKQNKHKLTNREALTVLCSVISSHFLSAEHSTVKAFLFVLYKESVIFKTNFISKAKNSVVSMLYTLIEHATISQSESLLE